MSISVVISLQTLLMQDQYKHPQSVHVSADFYGEYQSDEEAKHHMCMLFNDISYFCCFVMTHKLNFEITSQTR